MSSTVADRSLSGNDISVHLSPQSAKGSINATPAFDQFRRLEGKAAKVVSYVTSNEVKTNRQARMQIQDSITHAAELGFELNESTAKYIDGLLHGDSVDNGIIGQTTVAATASGFTDSGSGSDALIVGDWFKISGFADGTIDGFYKISVLNSPGDFDTLPVPPATEVAGASVTIESEKTSSGSDPTYYTVQNRTVDKSAAGDIAYDTFFDAVINTGSIEVGETGIVVGTFGLNIEELVDGVALISGQTDNAIDTSEAVSSINNVTTIYVDGVDSECSVKSFSIEFNNNYQGDRSAACDGERYAFGDVESTGSLVTRAVISNTFDWRTRYRNSTPFALAVLIEFSDGNWLIIEIMQALVTEHTMPDGSNVIASNEMSYAAEEDDVTTKTVQMFRNFA
jgi:hypothetical protein